MGRKRRVITTETIEGEEGTEPQDEPTAKKKKTEEEENQDTLNNLDKFIKGMSKKEMANVTVRIRRVSPTLYKGHRISGLIDEVSLPFDPMEIKQSYGGGRYQFEIMKGNKQIHTFYEEFPGKPIIEVDDSADEPVKSKDPQSMISDHLERRLKNVEMTQALKQAESMDPSQQEETFQEESMPSEMIAHEAAKKAARMVLRQMNNQANQGQMITSLITALAPMMRPPDQGPLIQALVNLVANKSDHQKQIEPKDMIAMVTPLISEFSRSQSDLRKIEMTNMGSMQSAMMSRMMDLMGSSGAEQDEIDKVRKWMAFAQEAFSAVRSTGLINPPIPQRRLPPKTNPPIAIKPEQVKAPATEPAQEETQMGKDGIVPKQIKDLTPEDLAKFRVNVFLSAVEKEMQVKGNPDAIYNEDFESVFNSLPKEIRDMVTGSNDQMAIISTFAKYGDAELVNNITKIAMEDAESGKWLVEFFDTIRNVEKEIAEDKQGEGT